MTSVVSDEARIAGIGIEQGRFDGDGGRVDVDVGDLTDDRPAAVDLHDTGVAELEPGPIEDVVVVGGVGIGRRRRLTASLADVVDGRPAHELVGRHRRVGRIGHEVPAPVAADELVGERLLVGGDRRSANEVRW